MTPNFANPLTRRRLPSLPSSVVAATASRRGIVARSPVDFQRVASRSACYRSAPATPCCYCCYCCCYSADRYQVHYRLTIIFRFHCCCPNEPTAKGTLVVVANFEVRLFDFPTLPNPHLNSKTRGFLSPASRRRRDLKRIAPQTDAWGPFSCAPCDSTNRSRE